VRKFNCINNARLKEDGVSHMVKVSALTGPTTSDTWETVVPEAAPKYKTLAPGLIQMFSIPPTTAAAIFDLKGFQTRYSTFPSGV
jgi:hypothetical protein